MMNCFEIFAGEFVELTTSEYVEGVYYDEDNGPINFREPITITGYIVDFDDTYFLIGEKHDEVSQAIEKARIWRIRMIDPQALIQETLEKFPIPTNKDEAN
jgi:hypothetical protein